MTSKNFFAREQGLAAKALDYALSAKVLAWQLGGTMVAAVCFAVLQGLALERTGGVQFALGGLGFIVAYVVLSATGCLVTHLMDS